MKQVKKNDKKYFFTRAFLGASVCTFMVLFFISALNKKKMNLDKKIKVSQFKVQDSLKDKVKETQKIKKKVKPKNLSQPKMSSLISGLSFGLPVFDLSLDAAQGGLDELSNNSKKAHELDIKPKLIFRPPLEFPEQALEEGMSGFVKVSLLIGRDGGVEDIRLVEAQPGGVFEQAAIANVKTWKFRPGQVNGRPVASWQLQRISFSLGG